MIFFFPGHPWRSPQAPGPANPLLTERDYLSFFSVIFILVEEGCYELHRGRRTVCTISQGGLLGNLLAGMEQQVIEHALQLIISLLEEVEASSCVLMWYYLSLILCSFQSKMLSLKFCEDCFQVVEQQFVLGINQFAAGAWKALKKMSLYLQAFCFVLILIWPCRS